MPGHDVHLALSPLPGGLGALVDHDLTCGADPESASHLQAALRWHRLLVFPGQHLNHADLLAIGGLFGAVDTDVDRRYAVPGFPGLTVISNIVENGRRIGIYDGDHEDEWHADNSFKPELTAATLLYAVITPRSRGQTRFADTTRAFADLPADLKDQVRQLRAVHSIQELSARQTQAAGQSSAAAGTLARLAEVEHPIAPSHPGTGLPSLLLGTMVVKAIVGLSPDAGTQLLARLLDHATSSAYVYTHRWSPNDLVVWDNRALLHSASPCDSTVNFRLLYRAAIR